jgi:hypothetical protein
VFDVVNLLDLLSILLFQCSGTFNFADGLIESSVRTILRRRQRLRNCQGIISGRLFSFPFREAEKADRSKGDEKLISFHLTSESGVLPHPGRAKINEQQQTGC